ncbi:MAG: D-alanyl-D-alanine carboxypeptidase [Solobacterium sp.]|nr:D-alanyl-D-alanine carboxypeptidase [Solobacterium sp.]
MRKTIIAAGISLLTICSLTLTGIAENEHPDDAPDIASEYVYMVDSGNGQVIWSLNSEDRMYPASMTKLMTEILAIEALTDPDERVMITPEMTAGLYEANASVAGYQIGDEPTVRDLLYGTALASGAECVNALAILTDGSVQAFVDHMNRKAEELGMHDTHFVNPTGLHDGDHYSTCRDIETLFAYCYQNEFFRELLRKRTYLSTPVASAPNGIPMESTVWSMIQDTPVPGFAGGKTGFTYPAGRCLASGARINGMDLVLVTGKAPNDPASAVNDAMTVYGWLSEHMSRRELIPDNDFLAKIRVTDSETQYIAVYSEESYSRDVLDSEDIRVIVDFPPELIAPVSQGEYLGKITVYSGDELLYEYDFDVLEEIPYSRLVHIKRILNEFYSSHPFLCRAAEAAAGLLLILLISRIGTTGKRRRRRRH